MKYCPVCHKQVEEAATFCHQCGHEFDSGSTSVTIRPADSDDETNPTNPEADGDFSKREMLSADETIQGQFGLESLPGASPSAESTEPHEPPRETPFLSEEEKRKLKQKLKKGKNEPPSTRDPGESRPRPDTDKEPSGPTPEPEQQTTESSVRAAVPETDQPADPRPTRFTGKKLARAVQMLFGVVGGIGVLSAGIFQTFALPGSHQPAARLLGASSIVAGGILVTVPTLRIMSPSRLYGLFGGMAIAAFVAASFVLPQLIDHWTYAMQLIGGVFALCAGFLPHLAEKTFET